MGKGFESCVWVGILSESYEVWDCFVLPGIDQGHIHRRKDSRRPVPAQLPVYQ